MTKFRWSADFHGPPEQVSNQAKDGTYRPRNNHCSPRTCTRFPDVYWLRIHGMGMHQTDASAVNAPAAANNMGRDRFTGRPYRRHLAFAIGATADRPLLVGFQACRSQCASPTCKRQLKTLSN